jgi:hypothetical protein
VGDAERLGGDGDPGVVEGGEGDCEPVPSAPMIRSAGMRVFSRVTVLVGEPLIPSFFSGAPKLTPGSIFSTRNAEISQAPRDGSVTAITA